MRNKLTDRALYALNANDVESKVTLFIRLDIVYQKQCRLFGRWKAVCLFRLFLVEILLPCCKNLTGKQQLHNHRVMLDI